MRELLTSKKENYNLSKRSSFLHKFWRRVILFHFLFFLVGIRGCLEVNFVVKGLKWRFQSYLAGRFFSIGNGVSIIEGLTKSSLSIQGVLFRSTATTINITTIANRYQNLKKTIKTQREKNIDEKKKGINNLFKKSRFEYTTLGKYLACYFMPLLVYGAILTFLV